MFERFTEEARRAVALAEAGGARAAPRIHRHRAPAARAPRRAAGLAGRILADAGLEEDRLRRAVEERIGAGPPGFDVEALASIGIDLEAVRRRVEAVFGPGALERGRSGRIPLRPRTKQALELALREATELGHGATGTERVLLGLARADGLGCELLEAHGLAYERLRALVVEALAA